MNLARRWTSAASLILLMHGVASHATDVATRPLKADVLVKPNVIFGMDDSGSMDSEVMLKTNDGAFWWDFNAGSGWSAGGVLHYNDPGVASTQWRKLVYLFPNGTGAGNRHHGDAGNDHFAILPTAQFAFLRSSAHNPIYYDPQVTYQPWAPAYFNGALSTPPAAVATAARSHPVHGSSTMNLKIEQPKTTWDHWVFTALPGMVIPAGSHKLVCDANNANCISWIPVNWVPVTVDEIAPAGKVTRVAMSYFPATYYVRMDPAAADPNLRNCTVDASTCVTAPDGSKLKRFEIRGSTTFPVVAELGRSRTYHEELQNFANWFQYHRKRQTMLAAAMGRVMETLNGMRLGVVAFNNRTAVTMHDADSAAPSTNARRIAGLFYEAKPSGGTPTRQALGFIGEQYQRPGIIQHACQRNNAFIVTDGFAEVAGVPLPAYDSGKSAGTWGTGAPYETTYGYSLADLALRHYTNNPRPDLVRGVVGATPNDTNPDLHMNTYGLTLGARGTLFTSESMAAPTSASAWPVPNQSRHPSSIDDLWHATINGRGRMYLADTPAETAVRVQKGLTDMLNQVGAQAAGSLSSVNLAQGDGRTYLGLYNLAGWSGDLTANAIDKATGGITTTPVWSASARLLARTSPRIIATHNGTSAVAFQTQATGIAGRINPGHAYGSDADVMAYLRGDRSREGTAFRARTSLLGAIINARPVVSGPEGVVYAASGEGMLHAFDTATGDELWAYLPYSVLGQVGASTSRVSTFQTLLDGSPVLGSAGGRKLLVGGRGVGGSGYYALDVTAPRGVASEADLAARVLWEFPGASTAHPMGVSVGKPFFATTRTRGDVVLLTQGYNGSNDGRSRVYMLDAVTGALRHTFVVDGGLSTGDPGLAHLGGLPESDGKTVYAYGGDERGNLWRFDLENLSALRIAQLRDSAGNLQPVTAVPQVVRVRDMRLVLAGTGRMLGLSDLTSPPPGRQSIYAIKDDGTSVAPGALRSVLTLRTLSEEDAFGERDLTGGAFDWQADRGWYFDLPAGQQVNTDSTVGYGMLTVTANQAQMSDCSASSYLYVVDVLSGMNVKTGWTFEDGGSGTSYAARRLSDRRTASSIAVQLGDTGKLMGTCRFSDAQGCKTSLPNMYAVQPRKNAWRQIRR